MSKDPMNDDNINGAISLDKNDKILVSWPPQDESHPFLSISYWAIGKFCGVIGFIGCWIYAVFEYGWFLGLALGWIPSAIIAVILLLVGPLLLGLCIIGLVLGLIILYLTNK